MASLVLTHLIHRVVDRIVLELLGQGGEVLLPLAGPELRVDPETP